MSEIITIKPRNVAFFRAVRWDPSDAASTEAVGELAELAGWRVEVRQGVRDHELRLIRNARAYVPLQRGKWLVVLGNSGSLRTLSDREFHRTYEEVTPAL